MDALLKLAVLMVGMMARPLKFSSFKIPIDCDCGSADHVTFLSGIRDQLIWCLSAFMALVLCRALPPLSSLTVCILIGSVVSRELCYAAFACTTDCNLCCRMSGGCELDIDKWSDLML